MAVKGLLKTKKQTEIMRVVLAAMDDGREVTIEELCESVNYEVSAAAMLCSVRFLILHKVLDKETRAGRVYLKPTSKSYEVFRPAWTRS